MKADEARAEIRATLKGHSTVPITRDGRDREAAARGARRPVERRSGGALAPPGQADTPPPIAVADRRGFGFCWPCHDDGRVTLAVDPVNGSTCERHENAAAGSAS